MRYSEKSNSQRQKVEVLLPGARGKGLWRNGRVVSVSLIEFQLGKRKKFWTWMVVMVAEQHAGTYCYRTVYLTMVKMVNFYVTCIFSQ